LRKEYIPQKNNIHFFAKSEEKINELKARIMKANEPFIQKRYDAYIKETEGTKLPMVGEWLLRLDDTYTRFTHVWDNGAQTGLGSFHFHESGRCSYSGGLDPIIPFEKMKLIESGKKILRYKDGSVWHFDRNVREAHNGVYYVVPFRIFVEVE